MGLLISYFKAHYETMGSVSSKSSNGMTTVPLEIGTIQGSASEHRSVEITTTSPISTSHSENDAVIDTSIIIKIIQICEML